MTLLAESATNEVSSRATTILRELGYGAHETQVIIALSQVDSSTVSDLSAVTKIHHANLYSVLSSLEGKGVVIGSEKRPRIFQLAPLKHLKEYLSTKVDQLMKDLKQLQRERKSKGVVPALIYTIRGHSDVEAKVLGMLRKAKERILLVTPSLDYLGDSVVASLSDAASRGVAIRLILGEDDSNLGFKAAVRIKVDALATNLVIDGIEAMISMPDLSVCGWADNELIALQLEGFLEQTWKLCEK